MQLLSLVKAGYGSIVEVQDLDTDLFLDALEWEAITNAVQSHQINSQGE